MIGKTCEVEILGDIPRTIIGKVGARIVEPEGIRKILDKEQDCCTSGNCLRRWVDSLGEEAPIVLEAHRHAVAAMTEVARRHFFVKKIRELSVPKMRLGTDGSKFQVGKSLSSSTPTAAGSWVLMLLVGGVPLCRLGACQVPGQLYFQLMPKGLRPHHGHLPPQFTAVHGYCPR